MIYTQIPCRWFSHAHPGAADRQLAGRSRLHHDRSNQSNEGRWLRGSRRVFPRAMSYPSLNLPRQGQAFTLIEVLVSMAVLTILGLLILQLTTATRNATRISNRGIDTAAEVRLVFERLDLDLSALANRADVDFVVANPTTPGTAYSLLFISGVTSATASSPSPAPSPANNRGVSLIGYQVGTVPSGTVTVSQPCLLRAAKSVMWTDVSLLGIWRDATATGSLNTTLPLPLLNASPAPSPAATPAISLAATDFDVLSPAIIRMAVGFQLYPSGSAVTFG